MRKYFLFLSFSLLILVLSLGLKSFSPNSTSPNRVRFSINKNSWKFFLGGDKNASKKGFNDAGWQSITIPHDFNGGIDGINNSVFKGRFDFENDPDKRMMYKGPGWYRTSFQIDKKFTGKRVF